MRIGRRDIVPASLNHVLVQWAKWSRGTVGVGSVGCESAERGYLAPAGEVYSSAEEALEASIRASERKGQPPYLVDVDRAVLRLTRRQRAVIKLEYIDYKRKAFRVKLAELKATEDEYWALLARAATTLTRLLTSYLQVYKIPAI